MTVITKPLSQERKDEKPEKEVTDPSKEPTEETKASCDETVVIVSDSKRICVDLAVNSHARQRTRSTKSSSRNLFLIKICLLIPALFSIFLGFTIFMDVMFKMEHGRQTYKGYCRVPYPNTLFGELELSPGDWTDQHATGDGHDHGNQPSGFWYDEGKGNNGFTGQKKSYRLITGDFVKPCCFESKHETQKEKAIKQMMERLVQHIVAKNNHRKSAEDETDTKSMNDEIPKLSLNPMKPLNLKDELKIREIRDKIEELKDADTLETSKDSTAMLDTKENDALGKNFELDFDIDIDSDREELQMPELSKGKYLHDFKMNKTAIVDPRENRCFVFNLNRKDVSSPRSLYEILHGMMKGSFGINLQQIRRDMTITYPSVINFEEYGPVIKAACDGMKTYRLVPAAPKKVSAEEVDVDITSQRARKIGSSRARRSTNVAKDQIKNLYQEFAGKYIQYNIVNLNEIE